MMEVARLEELVGAAPYGPRPSEPVQSRPSPRVFAIGAGVTRAMGLSRGMGTTSSLRRRGRSSSCGNRLEAMVVLERQQLQ